MAREEIRIKVPNSVLEKVALYQEDSGMDFAFYICLRLTIIISLMTRLVRG
jgi:hypothetical protein